MAQDMSQDVAQDVQFAFHGPQGAVTGSQAQPVPRGTATSLAARLEQAFARAAPGAIIGGALPFDRADDDCLWLAAPISQPPAMRRQTTLPLTRWRLTAEPSADEYADIVGRALAIMDQDAGGADALKKIVLARSLLIEADAPIPVDALLARLGHDPAVTAFQVALPPREGMARTLCGATPELLIEKRGANIASHPLAGSARRARDATRDRLAADALMRSDKDRREHAIVVEYILDTLAPWCRDLGAPDGTALTCTETMWHLGTRIEGRLIDEATSPVVLAALLHPTPAVGGMPVARASRLIRALEPVARDFYAGAVGWCDAQGAGAWHVAIRCAEICGPAARLYAGAGIVAGSDPWAEAAETGAKFGAFLAALGLPADAGLADITTQGHA